MCSPYWAIVPNFPYAVGLTPFDKGKILFLLPLHSALEGIRTPNLLIRSQMLYPLSYKRSRTR